MIEALPTPCHALTQRTRHSGSHLAAEKRLVSWQRWKDERGFAPRRLRVDTARARLERVVARWSEACAGRARLPWT
jgi:hypothetical protein